MPRLTWDSPAQVWFLQRRFHKDILLNPVLVLSFCPDLSSKPGHLGTATRELLFLLDSSSAAHKARGGVVWAGLGVGWGSGSEEGWGQPLEARSYLVASNTIFQRGSRWQLLRGFP